MIHTGTPGLAVVIYQAMRYLPTPPSPTAPDPHTSRPRPCCFIDRDGCITREAGYINHADRIELIPGADAAIRRLNEAGVLAILVTNQSGLARGYFTQEVLHGVFARLETQLAAGGARLDAIYYAPYHSAAKDERWRSDPDEERKPGLGMLRAAQRDFAIDLTRSAMIGDRHGDIQFARRAGIPGVLVKTGYGLGEVTYSMADWTEQPEHVCEDISEAVDWYLARLG